jgi:hypothetical protein
MYMPIELGENIKTFMTHGRNKVIESFIQHLPNDSWIQYFWTYYFNLVHDLTLNPLLLFHHVMHTPKYPLLELR